MQRHRRTRTRGGQRSMTCYTSALTSAAYAGAASHPPSTAAVRLFSLQNSLAPGPHRSATSKVVHLVRHAEGTHNLNEEESKLPLHYDANLTPRGIEQCRKLATYTKDLRVDAVVVSPMTRCLETARLSFPHLYGEDATNKSDKEIPFIAHEEWRETVNYLCDARRPTNVLQHEYPGVSFECLSHEHDPIWQHYENTYGSHDEHTSLRESGDATSLYNRAHLAWKALLRRPERHVALVGHSAFYTHMFTPLYGELEGVVRYEDDCVRELMTRGKFENCELRSVVVDVPID